MLKYYRIKDLAKVSTGGTPSREDEGNFTLNKNDGVMWIKPEDLKGTKDFIRETREYITCLGLKKMKKFSPHDSIIFSGIGEIGKMGIAKNDFTTNQQNHILYSISCNRDYLFYSLFSKRKNINKLAKGNVVKIFNSSELKRIIVGIPENEKQLKIVKYLRKNENSLEDKIKKYNKKIELLKEYKEALIYETVTKGLDKNIEMKDSGIDWIGRIPKSFSIKRLKDVYIYKNGYSFSDEDYSEENNGNYLIKITQIKEDGININKEMVIKDNDRNKLFKIKKMSILYALSGATAGKSCFFDSEYKCYLNQRVAEIRLKKGNSKYLYYIFKNKQMQHIILNSKQSTAQPNINKSDIDNFIIPYISNINKQNEIVDFLDKKTKEIDSEVEILSKKIGLIEELKESIIYECVTGKIDIEVDGEKYQKIIESI